ncbi:MAG: hypothetical protein J6S07_08390 [Bacteroidaceae bacterium]|nr:hypothetical protein [Bacteroidaceae bacterium]
MNKYIKLFALAGASFLLGACQEELVPENIAVPGDEIQFGANAYFENGEPQTRTEYGDIQGNQIEVRWIDGDRLDIACPETAGPKEIAEYKVVAQGITGNNSTNAESSYASTLVRLEEGAGLQWSSEPTHHFYAAYPSARQIGSKLSTQISQEEINALGLTVSGNNAVLKGYIPVVQNPVAIPTSLTDGGYVIDPDMTYAYMTAQNPYTGQPGNIGLEFNSQVTALQFQILPGDFAENTTGKISIVGVQVFSEDGNNIAGSFSYDYASNKFTDNNVKGDGHDKITMMFTSANSSTGIPMTGAKFLDVTFFLKPNDNGYNTQSGDLRLTVMYTVNDNPRVNTATISKKIEAKKKYFFTNIKMPDINDVTGSTWFSALNPKTYVSQVSIPVAGNAFSYGYSGDNPEFFKTQVMDYTALWGIGVRGFEFKTSASAGGTLENEKVVCNGGEHGSVTFGNAFEYIFDILQNPLYKNETAVIIATYQSYGGDGVEYNPQSYLNCLAKYLSDFCDERGISATRDQYFTKLESNSCVGDIRGKIAIIVRPGDDEYTYSNHKGIYSIGEDWEAYVSVVNDWGTGVDQWDKRLGNTYGTQGVYNMAGKTAAEESLPWGVSQTNIEFVAPGEWSNNSYQHDDSNSSAGDITIFSNKGQKGYYRKLNGEIDKVYMQCWERISPTAGYYNTTKRSRIPWSTNYVYLYMYWPESYNEKCIMAADVFEKAIETKGNIENPLFINSLASYFITSKEPTSTYPYDNLTLDISYAIGSDVTFDNQGAGGDWRSAAANLNYDMYQYLISRDTEAGPLGLVMMNYLGASESDFSGFTNIKNITAKQASEASTALPRLIMMNNFSFPLSTNPEWTEPDENNGNNGGNIGGNNQGGGLEGS